LFAGRIPGSRFLCLLGFVGQNRQISGVIRRSSRLCGGFSVANPLQPDGIPLQIYCSGTPALSTDRVGILRVLDNELLIGIERGVAGEYPERNHAPVPWPSQANPRGRRSRSSPIVRRRAPPAAAIRRSPVACGECVDGRNGRSR
jgi:hypothetical protein